MFSSKYFLEPARVPEQGAYPVLFLPKLSVVSFQATPLGSIIFHPLSITEPGARHNGVVVRNQTKGVETGETKQGSMEVLFVRVPSRSLITTRKRAPVSFTMPLLLKLLLFTPDFNP